MLHQEVDEFLPIYERDRWRPALKGRLLCAL